MYNKFYQSGDRSYTQDHSNARSSKFKTIAAIAIAVAVAFLGIVGYTLTHETIPAGYVGYVYDRSATAEDNVIEGTSVIDEERTGRIRINPITQNVNIYPTTIDSRNWTAVAEGDNEKDMSMQIATAEGKNVDADIYISTRPTDIARIIRSFGTKTYESIVNNDIYGLTKGKLSTVSQKYSIYDIQSSRAEIQDEVFDILSETLTKVYGIELVRFEIGTLYLPADIQAKIDQKTQAQNEVELAKLERQKQDELNQKMVDEQKAKSDAAAYEKEAAAKAELEVQRSKNELAALQVEQARLEKEAQLEAQKAYTEAYFRDKELDVQKAAVEAINPNVETIITSGDGEGYGALIGLDKVLKNIG